MKASSSPLITVGIPSAFIALIGTVVGMLLAFVSVFLPWYEFSIADETVTRDGLDAGGARLIVLVVAGILALIGFVLDPSRNGWLLGATFVVSAMIAADFSLYLTLDFDDIREGVWLGLTGGIVSALASAVAFALSQFEFWRVRAKTQFD